jgi:hypothetical protein
MVKKYPIIIGRAELVDLVDLALKVPAKIDTGAFRSSIHAVDIKILERGGKSWLTCDLLGHPCSPVRRSFETDEFSSLPIKNSTGHVEVRYEVRLKLKIGPKIFNTSFSLSDRVNNIYPILIGRQALNERFLVDVSRTSVNRMELKHLKGVMTPEDEEDLEI